MDDLNKRVLEVVGRVSSGKTDFAASLDISLAVLSHIASGRNKPGVELLQKILLKYPSISAEWLLIGSGTMEKQKSANADKLLQALQLAESRLQNSIFDLKAVTEILSEQKENLK